jgi:hydroxypyruvate reductase
MARAVEATLGERLGAGIIVVKRGYGLKLERIRVIEAGHPIPDEAGWRAAREIMDLARGCGARDLFLFLVSGGGSALLPCPAAGLSLEDKQRTTEALLRSGARVDEINAVRKHISQIKGGRLAGLAAPARVVALVVSDVVDDALDAIASGPTVPDSSTFADCVRIVDSYDVAGRIPRAVLELLERGAKGQVAETPKSSSALFRNVQNLIVSNNTSALLAARQRAEGLGYATRVLTRTMQGESRLAAKAHSVLIKEFLRTKATASRPLCLLSGGETTVTVTGDGLGGRNQEFALSAAIELDGIDGVVVLCGGTDGTDGPTDAAGGIVDGSTLGRGKAKRLDAAVFLQRNDSYRYLQATEDLLMTGPTLTNVMDLQITLLE